MAILKKIIISLLPLGMTGCYQDIDLNLNVEPVLCMNSLITAGRPIEVQLSHTWLYTDQSAADDHWVTDATVTIVVNGDVCDADYIPQEGDTIRLIAESRRYGRAEAEVTVPFAEPIKSVTVQPIVEGVQLYDKDFKMDGFVKFSINADVELADNAATDDFYRFSYLAFYTSSSGNDDQWDPVTNPRPYSYLYWGVLQAEAEPIFSEHIGVFESIMGADAYGFTFFTDRQFSGRIYTLHIQFAGCYYLVQSKEWQPDLLDCGYELTLHKVSKSYYDWANYVWHSEDDPFGDISEAGFGDPIWAYSNVSTGAGVVAAQAISSYTVNLRDFLETAILNNQ